VTIRGRRVTAVALTLGTLTLALPGSASAKALDPWWYSALSLDEHHREVTGKGVRIAVIDGAINLDAPDLKGADVKLRGALRPGGTNKLDKARSWPTAGYAGHGTAMTALIVGQGTGNAAGGAGIRGVAPGAEVYFYQKDDDPTDTDDAGSPGPLIEQAIRDKVDIISYSYINSTGLSWELQEAWDAGIVVVAGAGAANGQVGEPASIPGVVAVGAVGKDAKPWKDQPGGGGDIIITAPGVDVAAGGMKGTPQQARWVSGLERTGTSDATPLVAGALALVKEKYPDATGNQLIQQMIHLNGRQGYGWDHDNGFGIVNIERMLAKDPAGWPDVNPLLDGAVEAYKKYPMSAYRDPSTPTPTPTPTGRSDASAAASATDESGSSAVPWLIGGAALALGAAAAIIVSRNRSRRTRTLVSAGSTRGNDHGA
jgi:subtilisin family serine protease